MKVAVDLDKLKVGDKICYRDDMTVTSIGIFTHTERCGRYYFKWENGDSLFLGPSALNDIERCWMYLNTNAVITEDMVCKILDIYTGDCPSHDGGKAVAYIMSRLQDPEYQEYLRLKAKFENV